MSDYKKTLLLPKTKFPMKANLRQREPEMLKHWDKIDVYGKMIAAADENKAPYSLHDGPPYANGNIHLGHAVNKILKDIIVKSKNMQGRKAEYVPGWDCHGLPIELKVEQALGDKKATIPEHAFRKRCRDYAEKYVKIQRKEFERLGVFGVWDKPYLTMHPSYEAATARELGNFMKSGQVARSKKPIYWCCSCETALAEAEVEYADHTSPSIHVRFPLNDLKLKEVFPEADVENTFVIIWTTTPWTIPANMGVAVHPELEYSLLKKDDSYYILATGLVEDNAKAFGWDSFETIAITTGDKLEGLKAKHPIYDRESPICLGDHVTLEAGTGCVHTAPGHGREDYEMGLKYGLEVYSPLNDQGEYLDIVEHFAGLSIHDANPKVIEKLDELGNLMAHTKMTHSYPHCWRCKEPVIFRATTQWFITMEENNLRQRALDAIRNDVDWIPAWGEERIFNMIENRPDWCISRQRMWGVPIIALLCEGCDDAWYNIEWVMDMVERFEKHALGCDYWFSTDLKEIVPEGLACPSCGGEHWRKSKDILDVWFDSGTSFAAVVEQRDEHHFPADMYLEGSDQHRGWFHSSLLASIGTRECAPYKEVLTHGYTVDENGHKMSKSVGNVIAPQEVIDQNGAEILRMWVSSVDYREDVRISDEILNRIVDAYRRLRNTTRYLLSVLGDFDPKEAIAYDAMLPLDRYALDIAGKAHEQVRQAYDSYEFHRVYHTLYNLSVVDLSAFYLDILKDRLYVEEKDGLKRRSAQTVCWKILIMLIQDMAPIMSFTAEEAYSHLPEGIKKGYDAETVFALRDEVDFGQMDDDERTDFEKLSAIRAEVNRAIEPKRKDGVIGKPLDAAITLYAEDSIAALMAKGRVDEMEYFIVSSINVKPLADAPVDATAGEELEGLKVTVSLAEGEKCERCWRISTELGTNPEHPAACPRCTTVLATLSGQE